MDELHFQCDRFRCSMKVTCEKLHSIELKSYCYGYWYFHDCATFTSDDHSYININCKVLVVFGVVLVRSTSKTFSYKFLLIELLGALGRCVLVINALQSITLLINSEIVCYLNPLEKWVFHRHWHRHLGEAFYWQIKPTCCCCSWFFSFCWMLQITLSLNRRVEASTILWEIRQSHLLFTCFRFVMVVQNGAHIWAEIIYECDALESQWLRRIRNNFWPSGEWQREKKLTTPSLTSALISLCFNWKVHNTQTLSATALSITRASNSMDSLYLFLRLFLISATFLFVFHYMTFVFSPNRIPKTGIRLLT